MEPSGLSATPSGGIDLSELVQVIDSRGRVLTPCRRKVAEREVRLNRAKWAGPNRIRLRFDPFAYRYIRLKVLERDQRTCYWCGGLGDTMDHVIPWSKGGRTTMNNCICACEVCNGQRGDMPADEFARLRNVPPPRPDGNTPTRGPELPVYVCTTAGAEVAVARAPDPVTIPLPAPVPLPAMRPVSAPASDAAARQSPAYALAELLDPHLSVCSVRLYY